MLVLFILYMDNAIALSVCLRIFSDLFFCHRKKAHVDCLPSETLRLLLESVLNTILCSPVDVAFIINY